MLSDFLEPFCRVKRSSAPNGLGSSVETWEDGESFRGGVTHVPGTEISVAGHQALRAVPVLVHEVDAALRQDEYVRRLSDGAVFRVAGNSADMRAPAQASVAFAQVPVEVVAFATTSPDGACDQQGVASTGVHPRGWPEKEVIAT